jgi:hypothetical protein
MMGSNGARFAVLAVAVAAVVALFVILSGGDDEDLSTTTAAQTAPTTEVEPTDGPDKPEKERPKPAPEPEVPTIEVKGGQPVGGVQDLQFQTGERILFKVTTDTALTFHLHGYDIEQSAPAGGSTTFDVPADIEGVFEFEEHDLLTPLAEVTVAPG